MTQGSASVTLLKQEGGPARETPRHEEDEERLPPDSASTSSTLSFPVSFHALLFFHGLVLLSSVAADVRVILNNFTV